MRVNFNDAFKREYSDAEFERKYGRIGRIPFAPNNSIQRVAYEPEYDRYGGETGMDISETLFAASTEAVLHVLTSPNGADLSVRAGHAFKFLILGSRIFIRPERWVPFLEANQQRWTRFLDVYKIAVYDDMVAKYERQRNTILQELDDIVSMLEGRRRPSADEALLLPALRSAAASLLAAHAAGALDSKHQAMNADDLLESMFTSYLHMHCNRLGMLAVDEIYLSILGRHALLESLGGDLARAA
jgi:thiopeptide-type bacteriocin biosynthesis protein